MPETIKFPGIFVDDTSHQEWKTAIFDHLSDPESQVSFQMPWYLKHPRILAAYLRNISINGSASGDGLAFRVLDSDDKYVTIQRGAGKVRPSGKLPIPTWTESLIPNFEPNGEPQKINPHDLSISAS